MRILALLLLLCTSAHAVVIGAPQGGQQTTMFPFLPPGTPAGGTDAIINVKDAPFNAFGDGNVDDTQAIWRAIDSCPKPLATLTATVRHGCVIYFPPGFYRVGNIGGRCSGGDHVGTPCNDNTPCVGATNNGYCAILDTGNASTGGADSGGSMTFMGAGSLTSEIVMRCSPLSTCAGISAIHLGPYDNQSAVQGLRVFKRTSDPGDTGHGIVVQSQRARIQDVQVEKFGGNNIFVDGLSTFAKANGLLISHVFVSGARGNGIDIFSHSDGSMHTIENVISESNLGYGFHIRSSKNSIIGTQVNSNTLGGVYFETGTNSQIWTYCETASQPFCVKFDAAVTNVTYFDLSGSIAADPSQLVDNGQYNTTSSAGQTVTRVSFASLGAPTNGTEVYCRDCDPPANPPVACTSAGAKTGAIMTRINGVNVCHF